MQGFNGCSFKTVKARMIKMEGGGKRHVDTKKIPYALQGAYGIICGCRKLIVLPLSTEKSVKITVTL